jgi:hypothetical protein
MTKNISKIEKFNCNNIINLNQNVSDKRYLILDLWENIKGNKSENTYNQIFLQINNLNVSNVNLSENRVYFDLTNNEEIIDAITAIELKLMSILKEYLSSKNKKGKFNFRSIIKDDRSIHNDGPGTVALALNLSNQDYDVSFYDIAQRKTNKSIINKNNAMFNIILELMYINLDMNTGIIVADTRLRMCMETRIKISTVNLFIQDESKSDHPLNNFEINNPDSIKQSFDITQTEIFIDEKQNISNTLNESNTNHTKPKHDNNTGNNTGNYSEQVSYTKTHNDDKVFDIDELEKQNKIESQNVMKDMLNTTAKENSDNHNSDNNSDNKSDKLKNYIQPHISKNTDEYNESESESVSESGSDSGSDLESESDSKLIEESESDKSVESSDTSKSNKSSESDIMENLNKLTNNLKESQKTDLPINKDLNNIEEKNKEKNKQTYQNLKSGNSESDSDNEAENIIKSLLKKNSTKKK